MTCEKRVRIVAIVVAVGCWIAATPRAYSGDDRDVKVKEASTQSVKAAKVFEQVMQTPDKAIPEDLLKHAKAIAVFPQVHKAAFFIGAEGGRGVVSRRTTKGWGEPVFFRAGGGSVGPQLGASESDIVLLFMNDEAVGKLLKDRFELGADAGVAAGPVGRAASAGTDALMHAQILSYSRSRGFFCWSEFEGHRHRAGGRTESGSLRQRRA